VRCFQPDKARIGSFGSRIQVDPSTSTSIANALIKILPQRIAVRRTDAALERGEHRHRQAVARAGRRVVLVFTTASTCR